MTNAPPGRQVKGGLVIGRFRGVPIEVMPSWLLVAALLAAVYGPVIDDAVPGIGTGASYLAGAAFALLFGFCVLAHELGHTWSASRSATRCAGSCSSPSAECRRSTAIPSARATSS